MRKTLVWVAAVALVVLTVPQATADTVVWDRYDPKADSGVCFMLEDDGTYWVIRYVDSGKGLSGQFDSTDRVVYRYKVPFHRYGRL